MNLQLHGPMGDHIVLTGIPEAYYTLFGEKVHVPHQYAHEFWMHNPYVTSQPSMATFSVAFNAGAKDYMIYYPIRVFYDMTGHIVDRSMVQPNLYMSREPLSGLIIVNDQAGWPSRKGYSHFDSLCDILMQKGYQILYLRNEGYRDCVGQESPRQIKHFHSELRNPSIPKMIDALRSASLYIGYESGIAQLAGALKVPYIMLAGSVPPINVAHDTCIYALKLPHCKRCHADICGENCLRKSEGENEAILETIHEHRI